MGNDNSMDRYDKQLTWNGEDGHILGPKAMAVTHVAAKITQAHVLDHHALGPPRRSAWERRVKSNTTASSPACQDGTVSRGTELSLTREFDVAQVAGVHRWQLGDVDHASAGQDLLNNQRLWAWRTPACLAH